MHFPTYFAAEFNQSSLFNQKLDQWRFVWRNTTSKNAKKCKKCSCFATTRGAIIYGSPCKCKSFCRDSLQKLQWNKVNKKKVNKLFNGPNQMFLGPRYVLTLKISKHKPKKSFAFFCSLFTKFLVFRQTKENNEGFLWLKSKFLKSTTKFDFKSVFKKWKQARNRLCFLLFGFSLITPLKQNKVTYQCTNIWNSRFFIVFWRPEEKTFSIIAAHVEI